MPHRATQGSTSAGQRQKEVKGRPRPGLYWASNGAAHAGQARASSLGLASLKNSSWPWGRGASLLVWALALG